MEAPHDDAANFQTTGMAPAVQAAITAQYAPSFQVIRQLSGGEECAIWLVRSEQGLLVVRLNPRWRSLTCLG
jgi:hypothetical protein